MVWDLGGTLGTGSGGRLRRWGAHWPVVAVRNVWPRVVTWYGRGVPGPGWSCCVGPGGALEARPQKGFGTVAKLAVLAGLLRVLLQFLARGPRVRQWGPTNRGEMRDGRVSWGGVGGPLTWRVQPAVCAQSQKNGHTCTPARVAMRACRREAKLVLEFRHERSDKGCWESVVDMW